MKEFHIINVGVSIITNYQKSCPDSSSIKKIKLSNNEFWQQILDNSLKLNEIYSFLKENPQKNSAELNSFLKKIKDIKNFIEVYFIGTKTPVNEICVRVLEKFMKEYGITIYTSKEFPGYFLETYRGENRAKSFIEGVSSMLDHLIKIAKKKKDEAYKVFFNPTGGFKAHVIASAIAGFMTYSEVYYLNEEFDDVITFPSLFYLPKNKEVEALQTVFNSGVLTDKECEKIFDKYSEEIERLTEYGLIITEKEGKISKIRLSERGRLIIEEKMS